MRSFSLTCLLLASPALAAPEYRDNPRRDGNLIRSEYSVKTRHSTEAHRAAAVVEGFRHAWSGYKQYAFPNDELHPVSNTFGNTRCEETSHLLSMDANSVPYRNAWGASAVDAFSTALVMQQADIIDTILDYIPTIDYTNTSTTVSLFETTIRYLGGMLSGYDLLKGPLSNLTTKTDEVDALLSQSIKLADTLKFAFNTTTGVPTNNLNITDQSSSDDTNGIATIGTLVLEWTHLSDLTGDPQYAELSQKGESYLLNPMPTYDEPFPGLLGTNVNISTGEFLDASGGWVGGDDSFYEYLIKMYVYDQSRFSEYKDRWVAAADSSMEYLASHPSSRPEATWLAAFDNTTLDLVSEHLACFDGGNYLLAGAVLGEQKYVDFGLVLTDSCHLTYNSTATGIGPEVFSWNTTSLPANQTDFYNEHGFWIEDSFYDLRPEVIESYYYAYRLTGDSKYQDWAWDAFVAINATARTPSGYSSFNDVNTPGGGEKDDNQESFLFAEVMKYAYLIHAPVSDPSFPFW